VITREEFASVMDENMAKIVKFLAENKSHAYTDKEISEKLRIDLRTTFLTLVDLKMTGIILGKSVGGMYYYSITDHIASKIDSGELDLPEMLGHKMISESEEDALRYIG